MSVDASCRVTDSTQCTEAEAEADRAVLRQYYSERNFFTSAEGALKVLSIVVCTTSSVLWLVGGGCAGGARGAGVASAACAVLQALLCAAHALLLPSHPAACFYTDTTLSAMMGACLLTAGALTLVNCDARRAIDYVHGPLALVGAVVTLSSAVGTYAAVNRRGERARRPPPPAPGTCRGELDV